MIQRGTIEGILLKVDVFHLDLKKTEMHERTLRYAINNRERGRERGSMKLFYRLSKISEAC